MLYDFCGFLNQVVSSSILKRTIGLASLNNMSVVCGLSFVKANRNE